MSPRRLFPFHSPWSDLLDYYIKRRGVSASEFARLTHQTEQAVHGYLVGRTRPPIQKLAIFAAVLGVNREERGDFIRAGLEAHAPTEIVSRIRELEKIAEKAKPAPGAEEAERLREANAAVVAGLVSALEEAETLFFSRAVPTDQIPRRRAKLGQTLRKMIQTHARAPEPGQAATASEAGA